MPRKPRVGLALGSGAARGWAHIGVIRALERLGIKPDLIAGCSIGSFVGAAYAAGELDRL
ncbi:MAG: patatin-like phospholipase family protein, partial [Aeromonas veronii]